MIKKVISLAAIILAFGNIPVYATTIGMTVDGFGSNTVVGSTAFRPALGGEAVKYFIPLTGTGTCSYGVNCGTSSDWGSGGTVMSMFMKFDLVSSSAPSWLEILFEDLDLGGVNDPYGFFESIEIFDKNGTSLTGLIDDISSLLVIGDANTQQLLSFDLGVLSETQLWLRMDFRAKYYWKGRNTPEYLIATVTSVPEPGTLGLLGVGLLGLAFSRGRKTV